MTYASTRSKGCLDRRMGRRGSVFIPMLALGALLAVVGSSALVISRNRFRGTADLNDAEEARVLAGSAVEGALAAMSRDANWRTRYISGTTAVTKRFGRGTISWKLVDETDGNLSNNTTDAVRIYGTGKIGSAARTFSVQAKPANLGLEVLKSAVHAGGNISVTGTMWASGGPLSSNGTVSISNAAITVNGDVEAAAVANLGTITGKTVAPAPAKEMPPATVFDTWRAKATEIPYTSLANGKLEAVVLSPGSNPFGATNPNGVYFIDVPSKGVLTIDQVRIVGTLVIRIVDSSLVLKSGIVWEPARIDHPMLIAHCGVDVKTIVDIDGGGILSETTWNRNFNPPSTPYDGTTDTAIDDVFKARMRGLIHIIRSPLNTATTSVKMDQWLRGTLLVDGALSIKSGTFMLNSELYYNSPEGYTIGPQMIPVAGSYRWEESQ